jgi:hypothetical protein
VIAAELRVLKDDCLDPLEKKLCELTEKRQKGQMLEPFVISSTKRDYVVVFQSNAGLIGKIDDQRLREGIIRVCGLFTALVDRLNATYPEYQIWRNSSPIDGEKERSASLLKSLEDGIRNGLPTLQGELGEVLKQIERYLDV